MKLFAVCGVALLLAAAALFTVNSPAQSRSQERSAKEPSRANSQSETTAAAGKSEVASKPESTRTRKIPCKTPQNASLCYWTHGRLSVYNGNPTYRIWKIGTNRILGVLNGPSHFPRTAQDDIENPEFPPELDRAYEADNRRYKKATGYMWTVTPDAFADFEICPLEPGHKGWMQNICIESAKNIVIDEND